MRVPEINEMLVVGSFRVGDYRRGLPPEDPGLDVLGLRPD